MQFLEYAIMATLWLKIKLHELIIYKKSTIDNVTLSFWVFLFFQYFDKKIIDTLSDLVFKQSENLSKKW